MGATSLAILPPMKTKRLFPTVTDQDNLAYMRIKDRMAKGLSPRLTKVDKKDLAKLCDCAIVRPMHTLGYHEVIVRSI